MRSRIVTVKLQAKDSAPLACISDSKTSQPRFIGPQHLAHLPEGTLRITFNPSLQQPMNGTEKVLPRTARISEGMAALLHAW